MTNFQALGWLLVTLVPLLFFHHYLHREIQAILLILTRRADLTIMLYSLVFLPGVLLHEISHWLMAKLLGVRTGSFSVVPRATGNNKLQLGYVETAEVDWFRDALIGAAPLITGGIVVAYAGLSHLNMDDSWLQASAGGWEAFTSAVASFYGQPDFWLWFYIIFVVSSTMLPSASDRRAWLPVLLVLTVLAGITLFAGAGARFADNFVDPLNSLISIVAIIFAISCFVHIILLPPVWITRLVLSRFTGTQVV